MDYGVSRRIMVIAIAVLVLIYLVKLTPTSDIVIKKTKSLLDSGASPKQDSNSNAHGPPSIGDKVALLTDTQFTPRLIPLILHFHSVLGPEWPIVFFTSEETANTHLRNESTSSAVFRRVVADGIVDVRIIPQEYNMTTRRGVNVYLSRPWLWEQLAPAKHVLVFQTDAMICGNSHKTIEDFLQWDFIGAPLHTSKKLYNGGLSLRNRSMMMDILNEGQNWEVETDSGEWTMGGEDIWFSRKMELRGGNMPDFNQAVAFAAQHQWHTDRMKEPFGYHKVHKNAKAKLGEIAEWCPEIALAAPGLLAQTE